MLTHSIVAAASLAAGYLGAQAAQPAEGPPRGEGLVTASGARVTLDQIDAFIDAQMADLDMPGLSLAIFEDGEIVYSAAKGAANRDTGEAVTEASVFEAASLSKPVFAFLVLQLVDEGVLDLDRPLHEYLPFEELEEDGRYKSVTARMVLSHRTGFPNWRWFDPIPEGRGIAHGEMYQKAAPGTFAYSGEGYNYLAKVVAQLTGHDLTTLDALYQERIAEPLGLDCSSFVRTSCVAGRKVMGHQEGAVKDFGWPRTFPDDTPQTFGAAGRLHTSAEDYARVLMALIDGWRLSPETRAEMLRPQGEVPLDSEMHKATGATAWGLGIAIEPTPFGTRYEHGGNNNNFQSGMMFFEEGGPGYVFMTNSDTGTDFDRRLQRFITHGPQAKDG
ncbi:serine hydrolase domain-containing protein [Parvularcula oceani]|uniref:serine hydrolase domain-containing protein n=1 Tax=Parvularcula oceani TaxID=1247963 RepID=UPI000690DE3F|nr:serine hydrolase domain-containing protein [Parvularcula oceani]